MSCLLEKIELGYQARMLDKIEDSIHLRLVIIIKPAGLHGLFWKESLAQAQAERQKIGALDFG